MGPFSTMVFSINIFPFYLIICFEFLTANTILQLGLFVNVTYFRKKRRKCAGFSQIYAIFTIYKALVTLNDGWYNVKSRKMSLDEDRS